MGSTTMTRFNVLATAAIALAVLSGCHKKEISAHDRTEAVNAFSDAQFALSVHDLPRAETGYQKAAQLCPDNADYQLNYGVVEVKLGKKSDAKAAYKSALSLYQEAYKKDTRNMAAANQAVLVFLLLHRNDDAKAFLDQVIKDHPDNSAAAKFQTAGGIDKLADQQQIKDMAL